MNSEPLPLGFTAPNSLSNYGFQVQRPNVADLKTAAIDSPVPDHWFNQNAFVAPGTYELGSMTRWVPNIRFGPTRHADVAILKNFRLRPFKVERMTIGRDSKSRREHGMYRLLTFGQIRRLEQPLHRRDLQIVSEIVDVSGQCNLDRPGLELNVEVAEGNRMGGQRNRK